MEKFLAGFAVGAVLGSLAAFMFDPQQGRRRRSLVRDKVVHAGVVGRDYVDGKTRDLRNRAQGVVAEMRSLGRRAGDAESTLAPTAHGAGSMGTP